MHRLSRFTMTGLTLLLASASMARAAVRNVPAVYSSIQAAINASVNGDTVVVANGFYSVTSLDTQGKAITIKSSGGAGNCTLDGGSASQIFTIHSGEVATTVISGFTLQNGYGGYGGAVYVANSSPTITHCILQDNNAFIGGGALVSSYANPKISNCAFQFNSAVNYGGAIYQIGGKPGVTNCTFRSNSTPNGLGGGICIDLAGTPSVTGCTFEYNYAGAGGGVFLGANCNGKLSKCTLSSNGAVNGAGLYLDTNVSQVSACLIGSNKATGVGGGAICLAGKPSFSGCWLQYNSALNAGGIMIDSANAKLANCSFDKNQATGQLGASGGGGLWIATDYGACSPVVTGCLFDGNNAPNGGGIWNNGGNPTISRCTFNDNWAGSTGGGLYADAGKPVLVNCVFYQNTTSNLGDLGGALRFTGSSTSAHVTNCSFSSNWTYAYGDGVYADASAAVTIANTILWDEDTLGYEVNTDGTASVTATHSDVFGGWSGTGNLNTDPLYVDPGSGHLSLQAGSPCRDAGSPGAPYFPKIDILGVLRDKTAPDMGAYEVP